MDQILLMFHFFGLGAGFTGSLGGAVLTRQLMVAPGDAPVVGKLQPMFLRIGEIGLAILWITGPWMATTRFGGFGALPGTFWLKFLCVVGVTAGVIMIDMTARQARAGSAEARRMLPFYGAGTGALLLLVVVFAVLTFN
jgi:hypothetical protein